MGTTSKMSIPYPESTDFVADGATAMENIADQVDVKAGLVLVKKHAVGSSALSDFTVTDAFSSAFDSYRIIWNGGIGSATAFGANVWLRFGVGSTITTTGYYNALFRINAGTGYSADENNVGQYTYAGTHTNQTVNFAVDVHNPYVARPVFCHSFYINLAAGNRGWSNGYLASTTQFTSFQLLSSTGTFSEGNVYVYGYNNG